MSNKKAKRERKQAKESQKHESDKERLERLAKNTDFKLLKPFGPSFGLFHVPSEVTEALIKALSLQKELGINQMKDRTVLVT